MMNIQPKKLFTCKQNKDSVWEIDFGERKSDEQTEVFDYYQLFERKDSAEGERFLITGRNSVAAYFAAAYYLSLWGAKEISAKQATTSSYIVQDEIEHTPEHKPWLEMIGSSQLNIIGNAAEANGYWGQDVLEQLKVPIDISELGNDNTPITITGATSVLMYAALGVAFAKAKKIARLRIPHLPYDVCFYEDKIEKIPVQGNKNGVIIGILGDPNSGKSVFSRSFYNAFKKNLRNWEKIWLYDCDMASPTPPWYQENVNKGSEAAQLREESKTKWKTELEQKVTDNLNIMRTTLDVIIADMPGGKHPKKNEDFIPERITGASRAKMIAACDAYIILCRGGSDQIFEAWKNELQQYNLDDRILARFNTYLSESEEERIFSISDFTRQDENGLFHTEINNLQRGIAEEQTVHYIAKSCHDMMDYISYISVAKRAKAAAAQAFLTGNGGTRYGAAVRSAATGKVFTAGQYSSYNHATNIHAEMNVLCHAATAGEPDIDVLAIASTSSEKATPCGVCRQVMLEHSQRTMRDFHVLLVPNSGWYKLLKVSDLLPESWQSIVLPAGKKIAAKIDESIFNENACTTGAFYSSTDADGQQTINMVWDPHFLQRSHLAKIKYYSEEDILHKVPHAFADAALYQKYLIDNKLNNLEYPGLYVVQGTSGIKYKLPILLTPESIQVENGQEIYAFLRDQIFGAAGIDCTKHVFLTCSRLLNIHSQSSDYDLVVYAAPQQIEKLRDIIFGLIENNAISFTQNSGSLKLLNEIFIRNRSVFTEKRYCETFSIGQAKFSLMYAHSEEIQQGADQIYALDRSARLSGRKVLSGRIICAENAPYKRSESIILTDANEEIRILCYHKAGTLLKEGDRVSVCGNLYTKGKDSRRTLLLSTLSTDKIVWFS